MIFNEPYHTIKINSGPGLRLASLDSTNLKWSDSTRHEYYMVRSRNPLMLNFEAGDKKVNYKLRSKLSREYLFLNMISPEGIGYIIDLFSKKKYAYPLENFFYYNAELNKLEHYTIKPIEPGTTRIKVGLYPINTYSKEFVKGYLGDVTPFGINISGERFLKNRKSVSIESGTSRAGSLKYHGKKYALSPPVDSIRRDAIETFWVAATWKRRYDRWGIGGGLCASLNNYFWRTEYFDVDTTFLVRSKTEIDTILYGTLSHVKSGRIRHFKTGFNFNVEYRFNRSMTAGCEWQQYILDSRYPGFYLSGIFNLYVSFTLTEIKAKNRPLIYADH